MATLRCPKLRSAGVFGDIADRNAAYGGVHDSLDVGRFEFEISKRTEEHDAVGGVSDTQGEFVRALVLVHTC